MFEGVFPEVRFELERATGLDAGIERAIAGPFDVGLLSLSPSGGRWRDELESFREAVPQLPVVVLGETGGDATAIDVIRRGAQDYLLKGEVTIPLLARSLACAIERERIAHAQKVDAIGRLAGGVAHDFNNLLMVISGYGDIIASRSAGDGLLRESSEQIHKAVKRAAALTSKLLSFSRKGAARPVLLDLNEAIRKAAGRLQSLVREDVHLVFELSPRLSPMIADPAQLEQILVNLAANALDAMPDGGRLAISTQDGEGLVVLRVSDTGRGMDADMVSHLFEPFYTTKQSGGLAGLGLSTVHGIVKQCGGEIRVESTPGGTTFSLSFPASDGVAGTTAERSPSDQRVSGSERLLVVDDEPEVVTVLKEALVSGGYLVTTATQRESALAICAAPEERVDMILLDVVMPGMQVTDFIQELRRAKPNAKVALISGYTGGEEATALAEKADLFLRKPIERPTLLRELRRVLDVG